MLSKRQSGFERIQRGILPPPNNLVLIPPNRGNLEGKGREWLTYINFFFFFGKYSQSYKITKIILKPKKLIECPKSIEMMKNPS